MSKLCYNGKCETKWFEACDGFFISVRFAVQSLHNLSGVVFRTPVLFKIPPSSQAQSVAPSISFRTQMGLMAEFCVYRKDGLPVGMIQEMIKCGNPQCGKSFAHKRNKKYCCSKCARDVFGKKKHGDSFLDNPENKPRISDASLGAAHELMVCVDLLKRGHGVFRSQSPACPCDLVVSISGKLYRIEVRTGSMSANTGKLYFAFKESDRGKFDILAVVRHGGEIIYHDSTLNRINLISLQSD